MTYETSDDFGNNVIAIHQKRSSILFNKFNYIGCTILEYSKLVMYSFVYDELKKTMPRNYIIQILILEVFVEFIIPEVETYEFYR